MTDRSGHVPVLLSQTLTLLAPAPGETAVDCTTGRGGHSAALAEAVGAEGLVIGFDLDPGNLRFASRRIEASGGRFSPVHDSFVRIGHRLEQLGARADMVLADLGFSSSQMDDPSRGFSFSADGPLDMRYDPVGPVTAADLVASLSERELADLIFNYGEEPLARVIAAKLVRSRRDKPIETTARLSELVREAYGRRAKASRVHPATRTFMALRIAVNDELTALRSLLDQVTAEAERLRFRQGWLNRGARIAVICFHSLEDRIVKRAFADMIRRNLASGLTRKPVTADRQEVTANPRSRSARLRAVRVNDPAQP